MRRIVQTHHAVISADIPSDQIAARTNVSNEILILLFVNKCFHERERAEEKLDPFSLYGGHGRLLTP